MFNNFAEKKCDIFTKQEMRIFLFLEIFSVEQINTKFRFFRISLLWTECKMLKKEQNVRFITGIFRFLKLPLVNDFNFINVINGNNRSLTVFCNEEH